MAYFKRDRIIVELLIYGLISVVPLISACLGKPVSTDELTTTDASASAGTTGLSESTISPFDVVLTDDQATQVLPTDTTSPIAIPTTSDSDSSRYLNITGTISSNIYGGRFNVGKTVVDANQVSRFDDGYRSDLGIGKCIDVRGKTTYETNQVVLIASRIKFLDGYCH